MSMQTRHGHHFAAALLIYAALVLGISIALRGQLDDRGLGQVLAWLGLLALPPLYLLAWRWFRGIDELQRRIFGESVLIAVFASGFLAALWQIAINLAWLPSALAAPQVGDLGGLLACGLWYAAWRWRRWSYQ